MGLLEDLLQSKGDPVKAANADVLLSYESRVKKINDLEDEMEGMTDDQLRRVGSESSVVAGEGRGAVAGMIGFRRRRSWGGGGVLAVCLP